MTLISGPKIDLVDLDVDLAPLRPHEIAAQNLITLNQLREGVSQCWIDGHPP
jgi:hypothetical protein